jgi:hypothetical protein
LIKCCAATRNQKSLPESCVTKYTSNPLPEGDVACSHWCHKHNSEQVKISVTFTFFHPVVHLLCLHIKLEFSPLFPKSLLPSIALPSEFPLLKKITSPFINFDLPDFLSCDSDLFHILPASPLSDAYSHQILCWSCYFKTSCVSKPHQLSHNRCHQSTKTRSAGKWRQHSPSPVILMSKPGTQQ